MPAAGWGGEVGCAAPSTQQHLRERGLGSAPSPEGLPLPPRDRTGGWGTIQIVFTGRKTSKQRLPGIDLRWKVDDMFLRRLKAWKKLSDFRRQRRKWRFLLISFKFNSWEELYSTSRKTTWMESRFCQLPELPPLCTWRGPTSEPGIPLETKGTSSVRARDSFPWSRRNYCTEQGLRRPDSRCAWLSLQPLPTVWKNAQRRAQLPLRRPAFTRAKPRSDRLTHGEEEIRCLGRKDSLISEKRSLH